MNDFEKYALDQFPYRDLFRKAKSLFNFNVYHKLDDNGALIKDNVIYKLEYPLNNKALQENIKKINEIKNKYLENLNVYYSIIPDKSYFLDENYLKLDYTKMQNIMHENLKDMKYINIFENLDIEDYYKTDIHWKQEKILDVADKIKLEMLGKKENIKYNIIELGDFFGSYYGQVGINVSPDKQKYLTNEIIDKNLCSDKIKLITINDNNNDNDSIDFTIKIKNIGLNTARKVIFELKSDLFEKEEYSELQNQGMIEKNETKEKEVIILNVAKGTHRIEIIVYYQDLLKNWYSQKIYLVISVTNIYDSKTGNCDHIDSFIVNDEEKMINEPSIIKMLNKDLIK